MTGTGAAKDALGSEESRRWRIPSFAVEELKAAVKIPSAGPKGLALLVGLAGFVWLLSGVYKVQPDEQGVVLQFGRWVDTTHPGLHYHWPAPISTVLLPKVTKINQIQLGATDAADVDTGRPATRNQMLTGDENIVEADCVVFWQIKDAGRYLFSVSNPEGTLKAIAEASLREVASQHPIQAALSGQRQLIASQVRELLQQRLDAESTGIQVSQVQLQRVDPPYQVIDAFNDVQRARADQERARNEAEAYANDIIPRARAVRSRSSTRRPAATSRKW
jgi:membrane protease subunit HflK